ncbi:MAG: response regulator [Hyphomicrobiales bacterium]
MNHPVYLVDDDKAVRGALALLLKTVGVDVHTFGGPEELLNKINSLTRGCLVLDIRMPMITGLKLQEKLQELQFDWPTIIISGHGDIDACRRAFRNGAIDFLSKPIDEQDLIDAIQKGLSMVEKSNQLEAETKEVLRLFEQLSKREKEVLDLVVRGITSQQIAEALSLSPRTVESHRASIGNKLGTTSTAEQTRLWQEAHNTP